jgi:hypothetical protein
MGARSKEHPLLRTLVVCGASLVGLGCGGRAESDGKADGGGSAVAGSGGHAGGSGGAGATTVRCPEQCASPAQFFCDDLSAGINCRCDADAPPSAEACETKWDFSCKSAAIGADCAPFITFGPRLSCECSHERLHPEDCQLTAQFSCAVYYPVAEGCQCNPNAPTGPEECPFGTQYRCEALDPEIGCRCAEIVLIK